MNLFDPKPFFLVWSPTGQTPPTFKHQSRQSAVMEAERLARAHRGQKFFVLATTDIRTAGHFRSPRSAGCRAVRAGSMTEREEFDAWFYGIYDQRNVAESLVAVAFHFWRAGRHSVIAASGAAVEVRALAEPQ